MVEQAAHDSGHGWSVAARSIQGGARTRQEDAFAMRLDRTGPAAAVFDGVGGEPRGREAAQAGAATFPDAARQAVRDGPETLLPTLNAAVARTAGLTTCVAFLAVSRPVVVSVGDSYAYVMADDVPRAVNPLDRALGRITACLGRQTPPGHLVGYDVRPGTGLLLCSDGVGDVVADEDLARALTAPHDRLPEALERLMRAVERRGAPDNATAVLLHRHA